MGALVTRLRMWGKLECKILLIGLDAAGKTSILYQMKLGEIVTTIPTIGFNVETIQYKNASFTAWDVGGRDRMRPLFRHYFGGTDALIYVVDSNDSERMNEAGDELHRFLQEDELRDSVLLVLANKQDLPNALSTTLLAERLKLHTVKQPCHIIPTVATSGDGLQEALEWLQDALVCVRNGGTPAAGNGGKTSRTGSAAAPAALEDKIDSEQTSVETGMSDYWGKAWHLLRQLFIAH